MERLFKQFQELWSPLGTNQKISMALAASLVVVAMISMMVWASRPDMQLLYGGLAADEAGEIISKLEKKGVEVELGKGGGSIYVEARLVHKLRAELATDGVLPGGSGPGFELFDAGGFGISDFVQRTNFLRAVQGELARTITQFAGVEGARVMVVMPENRIVVSREGRDQPTASVFVDTSGGLTLPAVNAIRRLVANAIQGLDINNVAVVDSSGIDWTEELRGEGLGGMSNEAIRFRTKWESYFTNKVQSMLDRVLGPNQSEVRVAVDIDTSSVQTTETSFDPEGVVRNTTVRETSSSSSDSEGSAAAGGPAGLGANLPDGAQGGAAGVSQSNDKNKETTQSYEIGEIVSSRVQNAGEIRRLTASLLVSKRFKTEGAEQVEDPRSEPELDNLRQIVINALGIKLERGETAADLVTVQEMSFAPDPMAYGAETASPMSNMAYYLDMGKGVGGLLLGIGVIFFFLKMLKRNEPEQISMEVLKPEQMIQTRKLEDTSTVTPEMLNELIQQKPANIGVSLKEWIGDFEGATK